MCTTTGVRVVARRLDIGGELRRFEAFGERWTEGDRLQEKLAQRELTTLHVVGPDHCANAGDAVRERDEPEPAMIEPEDADVAGTVGVGAAPGIAEMAIHGGAVVSAVAPLGTEVCAEQGIAAGGVDEIAGAPALSRAIFLL